MLSVNEKKTLVSVLIDLIEVPPNDASIGVFEYNGRWLLSGFACE